MFYHFFQATFRQGVSKLSDDNKKPFVILKNKSVANAFEKPFGNPLETWFQGVSNCLETLRKPIRNPLEAL